jgi:hypothetical protein
MIEVDEKLIENIASEALKKLFEYNNYTYGDGTRLIIEKTKNTLFSVIKNHDFEEMIMSIFETYLPNITKDVVTEEIRKITRKTVKDMHTRGKLLNENDA